MARGGSIVDLAVGSVAALGQGQPEKGEFQSLIFFIFRRFIGSWQPSMPALLISLSVPVGIDDHTSRQKLRAGLGNLVRRAAPRWLIWRFHSATTARSGGSLR